MEPGGRGGHKTCRSRAQRCFGLPSSFPRPSWPCCRGPSYRSPSGLSLDLATIPVCWDRGDPCSSSRALHSDGPLLHPPWRSHPTSPVVGLSRAPSTDSSGPTDASLVPEKLLKSSVSQHSLHPLRVPAPLSGPPGGPRLQVTGWRSLRGPRPRASPQPRRARLLMAFHRGCPFLASASFYPSLPRVSTSRQL